MQLIFISICLEIYYKINELVIKKDISVLMFVGQSTLIKYKESTGIRFYDFSRHYFNWSDRFLSFVSFKFVNLDYY